MSPFLISLIAFSLETIVGTSINTSLILSAELREIMIITKTIEIIIKEMRI